MYTSTTVQNEDGDETVACIDVDSTDNKIHACENGVVSGLYGPMGQTLTATVICSSDNAMFVRAESDDEFVFVALIGADEDVVNEITEGQDIENLDDALDALLAQDSCLFN